MIKDLFKNCTNVEFNGTLYSKEVEAELPVFTLCETSTEKWIESARRQNTKMFIEAHNRKPENYEEVLKRVYSLLPERNNYEIPEIRYVSAMGEVR
ncbi:hypothetical protein [Neobacillus jeddahensis]|uniref:hypothetical protein n=1 Tax=Neobacillus jeddahensis TaxID=1461580 RepID=UPI0005A9650E|nr:hypothetical protein [Neobacillus jeddahensis]